MPESRFSETHADDLVEPFLGHGRLQPLGSRMDGYGGYAGAAFTGGIAADRLSHGSEELHRDDARPGLPGRLDQGGAIGPSGVRTS